ncbi:hypothetical protein L211DRAFT_853669 [Terfezia boudieri ATCC MYA-4762]|uniref:Uncharacterized protein n=1 Tax=Terfezia boudieri ATCC MYA-4762 TaxID=1051890 RepID=A0A3N4L8H7_9PEZI|nr:hypothetical protein L211DRAFT_853669 [Terfezia boudieri ATCC MYA-4762]
MAIPELRKPMTEINHLAMLYRDIQIKEWRCANDLVDANSRTYTPQALADPEHQLLAIKTRQRLDKLRNKVGDIQLSLVSLTLDLKQHPMLFIKHNEKEYCDSVQVEVKRLKLALLECQRRVGNLQLSFETIFRVENGFHWKESRLLDWRELFINPYKAEAWEAPRDESD